MRQDIRLAASIVTYHSPIDRLYEAIASFNRIKLLSYLILVDNHSAPAYASQLQLIEGAEVIYNEANDGFGFAHNLAMRRADDCDYYLVMNPDVVIHDGTVEAMVDYMEKYKDIGLLVPKVLYPGGDLQPLNKRLPSVFDLFARRFFPEFIKKNPWVKERMDRYEMQDVGYDKVIDVPFASGCFMLFRREALDAVHGFDEEFFMYLEDCDITRRVNDKGFRAIYLPTVAITHHWARGSHKSIKLLFVMIRSMLHYFRKWGWKWL